MPWNHQYSPLDRTIDQLEWVANQMRIDLATNTEITPEDYRSVLLFVERMATDLKPLQDSRVREWR